MCDTAEDMDEYIEYEFARDCIEISEDDDVHDDDDDDGCQTVQHHGSEHINEQEFLYTDDDYEIVEELDDEVDQVLISDAALDIKTETLEVEEDSTQLSTKDENFYQDNAEEDHLMDEDELNSYARKEDSQEIVYEELGLEETEEESESVVPDGNNVKTKVGKKTKTATETTKGTKGTATKYMLYDELVATVVDRDPDGTPIVEFSISNSDADEKLPMECGVCPDVMTRSKIPAHLRTHLVPGTNRYQCIYCEETYKDCKYLAGHARRHMGIRPYVCELCKLYFSTKQDLRVHNQRRHQKKDHICEVCGKTFAQNTQLKRHREATHEKKRRFKCDHCPKSYYKNFSLQEHIRAVHMGKRRIIVCPFCGMQCRDAHKMARHRKQMHLYKKHFECHICNEEFTNINYFDAHKRSIQCRNNTRRKLEEEEGLLLQQQEEEELQKEQLEQQQLEEDEEEEEEQQQQQQLLLLTQPKLEILIKEENSQQYSQNSNEADDHHNQHTDDDTVETVQIIDERDYKHLISASHHHARTGVQYLLNNDLLQHHKIEQLSSDDAAGEEELVYEITIDSNE